MASCLYAANASNSVTACVVPPLDHPAGCESWSSVAKRRWRSQRQALHASSHRLREACMAMWEVCNVTVTVVEEVIQDVTSGPTTMFDFADLDDKEPQEAPEPISAAMGSLHADIRTVRKTFDDATVETRKPCTVVEEVVQDVTFRPAAMFDFVDQDDQERMSITTSVRLKLLMYMWLPCRSLLPKRLSRAVPRRKTYRLT